MENSIRRVCCQHLHSQQTFNLNVYDGGLLIRIMSIDTLLGIQGNIVG